jgi:hypothetical protein
MKRFGFVSGLGLVLGLLGAPLQAQHLSVAGGVSLPQGDLDRSAATGWHGLASLGFGSVMQPLGLRLDAAYNRFPMSGPLADEHLTAASATLNLTYRLPKATSPISPYLIIGLGAYHTDCSLDCDASTRLGWNFGLGARLHALGGVFIEARYHRTGADGAGVHFFPLTIGLNLF